LPIHACHTSYHTFVLQLFADSVPSVPLSSSAPQLHQPQHQQQQQHTISLTAAPPTALEGGYWQENTLDESVWETLKRDVLTIGRNLRSVLIPVNWDFHNHTAALHNWDLWGPLVSAGAAPEPERECILYCAHNTTTPGTGLFPHPMPLWFGTDGSINASPTAPQLLGTGSGLNLITGLTSLVLKVHTLDHQARFAAASGATSLYQLGRAGLLCDRAVGCLGHLGVSLRGGSAAWHALQQGRGLTAGLTPLWGSGWWWWCSMGHHCKRNDHAQQGWAVLRGRH